MGLRINKRRESKKGRRELKTADGDVRIRGNGEGLKFYSPGGSLRVFACKHCKFATQICGETVSVFDVSHASLCCAHEAPETRAFFELEQVALS